MFELNGKTYEIPQWFINEKRAEQYSQKAQRAYNSINTDDDLMFVVRETAKAVLVKIDAYYGKVEMWVPKSILITEEQMAEAKAEAQDRRDLNDRYNTYLHETAKENGVKLGSIQKWAKIMAKLTEAGVKFMSRDEFATA